MKVLGVDYGRKRIGLAWCDTKIGVVLPYGLVQISDARYQIPELVDLIKKERIEKVVIGLPVGLNGQENENTKIVRAFGARLKLEINVPVGLHDERFTSQQAKRMGGAASLDEKAAMVILQDYLARK